MHKLCSLKEITPGSIVELPAEYQSKAGELGVILGLEYTRKDGDRIRAHFVRQEGETFVPISMAAKPEDMELAVVDDKVLHQASIKAFVVNKIALPVMGMSLGCDPEIFVEHGDGSIFPAWEYMPDEATAIKASKAWLSHDWTYKAEHSDVEITVPGESWASADNPVAPKRIPAYWDGAQAEFAPYGKNCLESLHQGTKLGLEEVLKFARLKDAGAKLMLRNVIELPKSTLQTAEDKYIQFRCSNSYNIYDDPGDGIQNAREYKYRCAGGHVHIGYTRVFTAPAIEQIVRGLDGILGVVGVSLAAGIDNPVRRHTYGRAGEFRLPSHGIEYRVLSNFWLSHPAIAMLVFELARASVRLSESGLFNLCWAATEDETRAVINGCDVNGARKILRRNNAVLTGMLNGIWDANPKRSATMVEKMRTLALKTMLNGIGVVVQDPNDIEKNWKLLGEGWRAYCRGDGDSWQSITRVTA